MSYYDYQPPNKFGYKDQLPEGDAEKVIKGSEFDDEFNKISAESQAIDLVVQEQGEKLDAEIADRIAGDELLQKQIDTIVDGNITIDIGDIDGLPDYVNENYVSKTTAEDQQIISKFTFSSTPESNELLGEDTPNTFVVDSSVKEARFIAGQQAGVGDGYYPWDVELQGSLQLTNQAFPPGYMTYTALGMLAGSSENAYLSEVYIKYRGADDPDNPVNPDPQPAKWIVKPNLDVEGDLSVGGSAEFKGDITVDGSTQLNGNLAVDGTIDATGNISTEANLNVTGDITGNGNLTLNGGNIIIDGGSIVDPDGNPQGGGGAVDSVNSQTGVVVLTASDVGALPDSTVIPPPTDLTGYATETWVTNQNFATQTWVNNKGYSTYTGADAVKVSGNQSIGGAKTFTSNVTAPDFVATSDERAKEQISPMPVGLIDHIKPVQWTWKESGEKSAGVIAQQLQEIGLDDFVKEDENGMLGVNYNALISILIAEVISLKKERQ